MNERTILFNDEMLQAILDGRKTQTRRLLKPQPPEKFCTGDVAAITNGHRWAVSISRIDPRGGQAWPADPEPGLLCRYGQAGDRLEVEGEGVTLEITDISLEQLQDITEHEAMAEGVPFEGDQPSPRDNFSVLWESIYGPNSWDANPWVWVIEFRRIEAQEKTA